jgi:predicted ATPase
MFLHDIIKLNAKIENESVYPFDIPAIKHLTRLTLNKRVTFFVGENGSGKSTLLEAVAYQCGFNPAGGSRNNVYELKASDAVLGDYIRLSWMPKVTSGFFLRAESFFHFANHIDELAEDDSDVYEYYGGQSLHTQSHGESFLSLFQYRFGKPGLYLLDEPEAALSPLRQLTFLSIIHELQQHAQLIIATHSPILLGYPQAEIFHFGDGPIRTVKYEETEHYQITRRFLEKRNTFLKELLDE